MAPSQEHMNAQCDTAESCYLLKSLHVLEVESNVEKAKVRIDEFKLWKQPQEWNVTGSQTLTQSVKMSCLYSSFKQKRRTYENHLDDKIILIGTLKSVVLWIKTSI